jgi:hypothetical protein
VTVEPIKDFLELARRATRVEFGAQRAGFYLLKRPRRGVQPPTNLPQMRFETQGEKTEIDPFAAEWRIAPVRKKAENPFPERLVVGRAPNCDVVLRVPTISKVHAHIMVQAGGAFVLRPAPSTQTILHNYRNIEPGGERRLALGDHVCFGPLDFQFLDAGMLYDILRSELEKT